MTLQHLERHDTPDGVAAVVHPVGREDSGPPILRRNIATGVAILMLFEAASLAVASALHLSGVVDGRTTSFDPDAAGIAEAAIGVVLLVGAVVMLRDPRRARTAGIVANAFALAGFLIGISETAQGGHAPDIAYHATVIPLLVISLVVLLRHRSTEPDPAPG
jgi:peptidoglycan/LPS O-acetylase OafA/YrhL